MQHSSRSLFIDADAAVYWLHRVAMPIVQNLLTCIVHLVSVDTINTSLDDYHGRTIQFLEWLKEARTFQRRNN
jgi:hypothetical protein